jgi:hypothetical protein
MPLSERRDQTRHFDRVGKAPMAEQTMNRTPDPLIAHSLATVLRLPSAEL